MTDSPLFRGCATALVTPFLPDGSLDLPALNILIDRQINGGMDALVILGTTGEPCTISMNEREAVISAAVSRCAGQIPVIVGTGSNDTKKSQDYARQAYRLGADGQLCVTPYYNKATTTGLVSHFHAVADCAPLPMILYHVPGRTGLRMDAKTIAKVAAHPGIVGIKEASGDAALAAEIIGTTDGKLPLYGGNDDIITALMAVGACGAISVCSNVLPAQTRAITQACLHGCFDQAAASQLALLPLIRALFAQVNPIPVKAALHMMGLIHHVLRLPLTPLDPPEYQALHTLLMQMKLITA